MEAAQQSGYNQQKQNRPSVINYIYFSNGDKGNITAISKLHYLSHDY